MIKPLGFRFALAIAFALSACGASQDPGSAAARDAAQGFYSWYQLPADSGGAGGNFQRAIEQRPETFGASLRAALEDDLAAANAEPGYIVGLDFDPFTDSQDPCERYVPDSVSTIGAVVRIAVRETCASTTSRGTPLTLELAEEQGVWRIIDIDFATGTRLSEVLALLQASRDSSRAPTA